jgi:hypothetical protein
MQRLRWQTRPAKKFFSNSVSLGGFGREIGERSPLIGIQDALETNDRRNDNPDEGVAERGEIRKVISHTQCYQRSLVGATTPSEVASMQRILCPNQIH